MYLSVVVLLNVWSLVAGGSVTDFYELLNVNKDASSREIRKAFKDLALELHPDKNKAEDAHERFLRVTRAYETLKDPDLRKRYDVFGEEGLESGQGHQRPSYHSWSYYHDNFGIYDNDPEIVTLERAEFDDIVLNSGDAWFVNFYSPGCSHCHELAPEWRRLARELENVIRIGAVNCGDEWILCREKRIQEYPTLIYYPERERYEGGRSFSQLERYVLRRLDAAPIELNADNWAHLTGGVPALSGPWLVLPCAADRDHASNCVSQHTLVKLTAMLHGVVNVGHIDCPDSGALCDSLGHHEYAVFYDRAAESDSDDVTASTSSRDVIGQLIRQLDAQTIAAEVIRLLPITPTLSETEFQSLLDRLTAGGESTSTSPLPCLLEFTAVDTPSLELLRLPALLSFTAVHRVHCHRTPSLCQQLHVRKHPTFALFRPAALGGGHEFYHGRPVAGDVAAFARAVRDSRLRALTPDDLAATSAVGQRPRLVDFFAPWCPPCMRLLPELRLASAKRADVEFGSVDCTVHAALCSRYKIRSYPSLIFFSANDTEPHSYQGPHSADGILRFIEDVTNPAVVELRESQQFEEARSKPAGQLLLIDFYANWCQPCRQFGPEYRRAARLLQQLPSVKLMMVDCAVYGAFCREQSVRSYPTVRLYKSQQSGLQSYSSYEGGRDAQSLRGWVLDHMPTSVQVLTADVFINRVLDGGSPWLVDFFAPWCGPCQMFAPSFKMVAKLLEGEVRCGTVDCQRWPQLCRDAGVSAYPTVKFYQGSTSGDLDMVGRSLDSQDVEELVVLARRLAKDSPSGQDSLKSSKTEDAQRSARDEL